MMVSFSLERVFGGLRFLEGSLFCLVGGLRKVMDNLKKQHIIVVDRCCMCKKNGEFRGPSSTPL
jgi:hypothetical protein